MATQVGAVCSREWTKPREEPKSRPRRRACERKRCQRLGLVLLALDTATTWYTNTIFVLKIECFC